MVPGPHQLRPGQALHHRHLIEAPASTVPSAPPANQGPQRNCAVAYSDKGSGNGMHDLLLT